MSSKMHGKYYILLHVCHIGAKHKTSIPCPKAPQVIMDSSITKTMNSKMKIPHSK
jgi:hypothetical protein